jgi:HPt (histidine-containing phosphotransfer) domain-containing protein
MLIYNYKKEFLGIDEADLEILGLSTLADLRAESADFADLFVKTPGCIHNFKHVHWIDYVLDKNGAEAKVIIHIKNKNYSANIGINTSYLVDSPADKAFSVVLSNVKPLTPSQTEKLLTDINEKPAPTPASGATELFTTPGSVIEAGTEEEIAAETSEASYDPYESTSATSSTIPDIYETEIEIEDLTADDAPHDEDLEAMKYKEPEVQSVQEVQENIEVTPTVVKEESKEVPSIIKEGEFANYVYNPEVASEELGLPIDLIEEFIQDFISQALSFKDELYQSIEDEELDNIKIQSHKLKGVAANLRIEDALDALTKANTSNDYEDIKMNLDRLYIMVDKLSGKTPQAIPEEEVQDIPQNDDEDEIVLSFKEDKLEEDIQILDSDVPDTITVAELADDSFLANPVSDNDINEDLSILDEAVNENNQINQDNALDIALEYDKELIANDIGIDMNSFNELFDDYIKESKELIQTISQSADNNDLTICKNLASKVKGMSENMRIHKLDLDLDDIINTTDTNKIKTSVENLISKLTEISTQE